MGIRYFRLSPTLTQNLSTMPSSSFEQGKNNIFLNINSLNSGVQWEAAAVLILNQQGVHVCLPTIYRDDHDRVIRVTDYNQPSDAPPKSYFMVEHFDSHKKWRLSIVEWGRDKFSEYVLLATPYENAEKAH